MNIRPPHAIIDAGYATDYMREPTLEHNNLTSVFTY